MFLEGSKFQNIFEDEKVRLESFQGWPENAHPDPKKLARAGFFYKGQRDTVQCFYCAGCLGNWDENDDPWKQHAELFPECEFLKSFTNLDPIDYVLMQLVPHQEKIKTPKNSDLDAPTEDWLTKLRHQLMDMYNNPQFTKLLSFANCSNVSIDLKSLFADISVTAKDTKNQPLKQLTLPDILSDLVDITMIEGEAGSGKTALLRKIAILWASGTCPMLSRFILVFYISVTFIEKQQTLSQIISKHLTGSSTSLTEDILLKIIKQLKNQVLFLLDDYGTKDFVPEPIENLLQKNHWNRVSLAVTVRTDQGKKLRQYARTILSIQDFPLYSSMYIYRHLFSHDIPFLKTFFTKMEFSDIFKAVLKTPMFTCALCVFWIQNPNRELSSDISVCKAYLMYTKLKHPRETERVEALVSLCGDLALDGVFKSQFDFTDEDLIAIGLSGEDALSFGLLSKFTSQRLRPIYRFFYPTFQEFLASQRMDDLLQSENEIMKEKGLGYLQQINTYSQVEEQSNYLKLCCLHSAETTSVIVSHLLFLLNKFETPDSQTDIEFSLKQNPLLTDLKQFSRGNEKVLILAIQLSAMVNSASQCASLILQYLKGKDICVDLSFPNMPLLLFLKKYPEGLSFIRSLRLAIYKTESSTLSKFLELSTAYFPDIPTVEHDYSMALRLNPDIPKMVNLFDYFTQTPVDISDLDINTSQHKIALLKIDVNGSISDLDTYLGNLLAFLSLADHIELRLSQSPGFIEAVWPCIDLYSTSFVKCSFHGIELNMTEQDLILQMSSLESLQMTQMNPPEYLLSHLDRFRQLKELIMNPPNDVEVVRFFPDGFKELRDLEKLVLNNVNLSKDSGKLAEFIAAFSNLTCFHLECDQCPEFKKVFEGLSHNRNIQEINLRGRFLYDSLMVYLASLLPLFPNLKIFDIKNMYFNNMERANIFVVALPCLTQLEELYLPGGCGIRMIPETIIQQFQYLRNLRIISFPSNVLNDACLLQLAHAVREGHLSNIEKLDLHANHDITQSGWRDFFQLVDHLPKLNTLSISRAYGREIKTDPLTFIALVQCVARLPSLRSLSMFSWLLDEKDIEMFNDMRKKHPQGERFELQWQWFLPFAAIVKD
ncbi:baculoviral IAP repeat-containing protein 1b isoform X1 [Xenopus laevis]|uniref:Baculoviral IAP repeat-containing protein 1b isoform X1 n=1 Tax=Xenopus laevis TaxID=8355 RepID=A0A8J1L4Z5_XENLA|nr:baculoviral IAP repeat-containing protein 1b isoform X1 [Xenopus laevis]